MSGPLPNFATAAHRHHTDAVLLQREGRWANADHFAGVAAECALKAILVSFLDGYIAGDRAAHSNLKTRDFGHMPMLWSSISTVANGRNCAQFIAFMTQSNCFDRHGWDISERYADGTHIAPSRSAELIEAARQVIAIHEQAKLDGLLS